jgi:hypothetical protein
MKTWQQFLEALQGQPSGFGNNKPTVGKIDVNQWAQALASLDPATRDQVLAVAQEMLDKGLVNTHANAITAAQGQVGLQQANQAMNRPNTSWAGGTGYGTGDPH